MRKIALLLLLSAAQVFGATASPVTITSAVRTSNVATITAAAHGLLANQGFCITGVTDISFNVCGTIKTVPTAATFTFDLTGANVSSSGGSVLPAKQIIILQTQPADTGNTISGVFWITTIAGIAAPGSSAWGGASTAEKNAIAAGYWIEVSFSQTYGSSTTKAAIQTDLNNQYVARQLKQSAASVQPGQFYGGYFDGSGWSF